MVRRGGVLAGLDLSLKLTPEQEVRRMAAAQQRLLQLRLLSGGLIGETEARAAALRPLRGLGCLRQGWRIKRLVAPLDPRHVRVAQFAAPT